LTLERQNVTFAEKLRHESRIIKQQFYLQIVLQKNIYQFSVFKVVLAR